MARMITVVTRENNFLYSSFEVGSKRDIDYRMANYGNFTVGSRKGASFSGRVKGDFIFLFTAQKFRKKTKVVPLTKKHTKKTGENSNKFKNEIIRRSHWKVRVYKFPLDRVISAKQELRTFKISITG